MPSPTWAQIRSPFFADHANRILCDNPPHRRSVVGVVPVNGVPGAGGRYAVFRVLFEDGSKMVARIGAAPVPGTTENAGFLGTALTLPAGQGHEAEAARICAAAGVPALIPEAVTEAEGVEIMWLPLIPRAVTGAAPDQWRTALEAMPQSRPEGFPVFTDRARTLELLHGLDNGVAAALGDRYDLWMETLFEEATRWSVVHGNPQPGHAVRAKGDNGGNGANGGISLIDFRASCWAPSVWDASGLVAAGQLSAKEAAVLFGFTRTETEAAVNLRQAGEAISRVSGMAARAA